MKKRITILLLALLFGPLAYAQFGQFGGGGGSSFPVTGSVHVVSGGTITIDSGGTFTCSPGSTCPSGVGTVTQVSGTAGQIAVATGTTTPVVSITSPFTFPGAATTGGIFDFNQNPGVFEAANESGTGTTANLLAKMTSTGAIITAIGDSPTSPANVVVGGAGKTGNAQLAQEGVVQCVMNNTLSNTEGQPVFKSVTGIDPSPVAGRCYSVPATTGAAGWFYVGHMLSNSITAGSTAYMVPHYSWFLGGSTGGANVQTGNYTALPSDNGGLVVMNCSSACTFTVPNPVPWSGWKTQMVSVGATNATVSLNSLTFNGSASIPSVGRYRDINFYSDGANYWGRAPFISGTGITFSVASNNITVGLTSAATTPNGQTCTLGSTCNVNNGAAQYSIAYNNGAGAAIAGLAAPTTPNGVPQYVISTPSGSAATAPTFAYAGVPVNNNSETTCATQTLNVLDRATYIKCSGGTTSTFTLPAHTGTGLGNNLPFVVYNLNSGTMAITPTTPDNIDGGSSQAASNVLAGWSAFVYQDGSGNWWTVKHPGSGLFTGLSTGLLNVTNATGAISSTTCAAGQVMGGATPSCTATPTLGASGTLGSVTMGNATSGTLTLEPVASVALSGITAIPVAVNSPALLVQTIAASTADMTAAKITSGTCGSAITVAAANAATTDTVIATPNVDPTGVSGYGASASGSLYIQAWVTAGDVNFKVCNNTAADITPADLVLNWRVIR